MVNRSVVIVQTYELELSDSEFRTLKSVLNDALEFATEFDQHAVNLAVMLYQLSNIQRLNPWLAGDDWHDNA